MNESPLIKHAPTGPKSGPCDHCSVRTKRKLCDYCGNRLCAAYRCACNAHTYQRIAR